MVVGVTGAGGLAESGWGEEEGFGGRGDGAAIFNNAASCVPSPSPSYCSAGGGKGGKQPVAVAASDPIPVVGGVGGGRGRVSRRRERLIAAVLQACYDDLDEEEDGVLEGMGEEERVVVLV